MYSTDTGLGKVAVRISFMPNYNFLRTLVWWLLLGIIAVPVIYLCIDYMSRDNFLIALIVWGLYMTYFIFDLIFRIPVKYIFINLKRVFIVKIFSGGRLWISTR